MVKRADNTATKPYQHSGKAARTPASHAANDNFATLAPKHYVTWESACQDIQAKPIVLKRLLVSKGIFRLYVGCKVPKYEYIQAGLFRYDATGFKIGDVERQTYTVKVSEMGKAFLLDFLDKFPSAKK